MNCMACMRQNEVVIRKREIRPIRIFSFHRDFAHFKLIDIMVTDYWRREWLN